MESQPGFKVTLKWIYLVTFNAICITKSAFGLGIVFPLTKKIPLAKKNPLTCASDTEKKFH